MQCTAMYAITADKAHHAQCEEFTPLGSMPHTSQQHDAVMVPLPQPLRQPYNPMRLPRLRRGPRPRTADDDDWGTSSPAAIMDSPVPAPLPEKPSPISRLKQQQLKSYTCTFSPRCVVTLYFAIAIFFIPIGSAIIAGTRQIRVFNKYYYTDCREQSNRDNSLCVIKLEINRTIPAPSYFYYSLTNFHQNARKYAKSRSDVMNQGKLPTKLFDVENCDPHLYTDPETGGQNGFDASEFIYPCGLTARSRFNDTFKLCHDEGCETPVATSSRDIAWWTDREHKFNEGEDELFQGEPNQLLSSEEFMVWMRLSAFPNFDKLYRIINEDLIGGSTYYLHIEETFEVRTYGGSKAFHISTVQWFGARNAFLGTAYLVVGVSALFIAIVLLVKHVLNPRRPTITDPALLLREKIEALNDHHQQQVIPPQ